MGVMGEVMVGIEKGEGKGKVGFEEEERVEGMY